MRVKVWGARGSVPAPGPEMNRYGGNTSCVELTLSSGETLIIDAGTGIRTLGFSLPPDMPSINILLTHLHLDHIQGLMFFPPCFRAESTIRIWGPSSPEASLEARIARYISAPLSPVEVRELPCDVSFNDAPATEWQIGSATIRAEAVTHRGPTLGYRITDGDTSLCYISDHEPALGADLDALEPEWISGYNLAHDADLLIHDCQYTDEEYPGHEGWGHSRVTDTLTFAKRVGAKRTLLFHHDPLHTDGFLDDLHVQARRTWAELGGDPAAIEIAHEREELIVGGDDAGGLRARLSRRPGRAPGTGLSRLNRPRAVPGAARSYISRMACSSHSRSANAVSVATAYKPVRRIFDPGTNTGCGPGLTLIRSVNRDRRLLPGGLGGNSTMTKRLGLAALIALVASLALPGLAAAAVPGPGALKTQLDTTWVMVSCVLVLFMQAGFLFLEIGFSRQKNAGAGVAKILVNLGIATIAWWAVGYGIAGFGNDFFGTDGFLFQFNQDIDGVSVGGADTALMLFGMLFCCVSLAIVWGTTLERIKFSAYVIYAAVFAAVIYPLVAHGVYGGGLLSDIGGKPVMDFAGSTVVHLTGAVGGLAALLLLGPRIGKYGADGKPAGDPGPLDADRRPRRADPVGRLVRVQRGFDVRDRRR